MKKSYYLLLSIVFLSATALSTAQCTASFNFTTNQNSLRVNFYDNSSSPVGMGMNYNWWFGDGTASSARQNPTHTYSAPGTYLGYFSIYDSLNTCFDSTAFYITVPGSANQNCNATYTVAKDSNTTFGVIITNNSSNLASNRYFWDFGDGNTSTLRNPSNTYQNFGSYTVCLTVTDTITLCSNMFCDTLGMDSTGNLKANGFTLVVRDPISTNIEENTLESSLSIYPNPANDQLTLSIGEIEQNVEVRVLDISGKLVQQTSINANSIRNLDISNLEDGVYLLQLINGDDSAIKKFIKQ